ncbi:MAG: hypothetical protein ACW99U_06690 [Candidatus Thorarchaeota archaeon]|jgi:predicted regulator of Ras-like GTPase activity (Roadblock/LC7/MglB family)
MGTGKMEQLGRIVEDLIVYSGNRLTSCVVTNERGLVVAGKSSDGSSSQALAAMISLLSDTAARVNGNLGFGHPKTASIGSSGVIVSIREFLVQNRWFRIGAVLTEDNNGRLSFFRRKMNAKKVDDYLMTAAEQVRLVLERN